VAEDDAQRADVGAEAPLVRVRAQDAELQARPSPVAKEAQHARAAHGALARVVGVDVDAEEQSLVDPCFRGERVRNREPGADVRPCPAPQVGHERGVFGRHALGDDLAHKVREALRDAAGRRTPET
jgi:hypothetical protein